MLPERSHLCMSLGRSLPLTATLDAVAACVPGAPIERQTASSTIKATAVKGARMRATLRDGLSGPSTLEEDGPAARQQLAQCALDPLSHLLSQLENETWVLGRVGPEMRDVDRLAESDEPLRRQRHEAQKPKPRKRRRDGRRGQAEQSNEGPRCEDHREPLFRPHGL